VSKAEDYSGCGHQLNSSVGPYAALDHGFVVEAPADVAANVERLLTTLRIPAHASPTTYRLEPIARSDEYTVWRESEPIGTVADATTAVELLLWAIDEAAVQASDRLLLVHAGAAEKGGRVVVVPGASGAGKSTVVSALVDRGWRYVTDEVVALDLKSKLVAPYPRAAKVELPAAVLLGLVEAGAGNPPDAYRVPFPAGSGAPVAMVVVPSVEPAAPVMLAPMRPADAVSTMAASTWNLSRHRQSGLDLLASLARRPCYRVRLGDPREVAAAIDRAVNGT
jgi:hypothetical protein